MNWDEFRLHHFIVCFRWLWVADMREKFVCPLKGWPISPQCFYTSEGLLSAAFDTIHHLSIYHIVSSFSDTLDCVRLKNNYKFQCFIWTFVVWTSCIYLRNFVIINSFSSIMDFMLRWLSFTTLRCRLFLSLTLER